MTVDHNDILILRILRSVISRMRLQLRPQLQLHTWSLQQVTFSMKFKVSDMYKTRS